MEGCRSCELVARRDAGEAPLWDQIVRTPLWDVVHCDPTSLEGWIVLGARRHVAVLADLDDGEAAALGPLVRDVSRALTAVVGCEKTYAVQFAEAPGHNHVHVHLIPRQPDLPAEHRGPNVFRHLGVPREECVTESRMDDLATALRAWWAVHVGA